MAIVISDKIDFILTILQETKKYIILIKRQSNQEDMNVYMHQKTESQNTQSKY